MSSVDWIREFITPEDDSECTHCWHKGECCKCYSFDGETNG